MTKFFSSEATIRAATIAMEIHAGAGYMTESPVQRYYRDAILARTTERIVKFSRLPENLGFDFNPSESFYLG